MAGLSISSPSKLCVGRRQSSADADRISRSDMLADESDAEDSHDDRSASPQPYTSDPVLQYEAHSRSSGKFVQLIGVAQGDERSYMISIASLTGSKLGELATAIRSDRADDGFGPVLTLWIAEEDGDSLECLRAWCEQGTFRAGRHPHLRQLASLFGLSALTEVIGHSECLSQQWDALCAQYLDEA